jgi:hypothetical protein
VKRGEEGAAEDEEAGWKQNQKQEPHTKMWGKMKVLDFVLVLSEGHTQLNAFI